MEAAEVLFLSSSKLEELQTIDELAYQEFLSWPEDTVDNIITDIAKAIYAQAK